jgi:predicted Rdx family selenoprotein
VLHSLRSACLYQSQQRWLLRTRVLSSEIFQEFTKWIDECALYHLVTGLRSIWLCNSSLQSRSFARLVPRRFNEEFKNRFQQSITVINERCS